MENRHPSPPPKHNAVEQSVSENTALWLALWIVLPLALQAAPAETVTDPLLHYRESPLVFHRSLREAFTSHRDVSAEVTAIRERAGDHSFDSLFVYSRRKHQAFLQQSEAWQAWETKDYPLASKLYGRAARQFLQEGARSEAAFSLYYIAEICAEQEDFTQSLRWLDQAAEVIASTEFPYLEALIFQSQGYSFWFLDRLRASARAFSLALERWTRITLWTGYHDFLEQSSFPL